MSDIEDQLYDDSSEEEEEEEEEEGGADTDDGLQFSSDEVCVRDTCGPAETYVYM